MYWHCRKKQLLTEMLNTRNWPPLFPLPYTTPFQLITSKLHGFTIFLYPYLWYRNRNNATGKRKKVFFMTHAHYIICYIMTFSYRGMTFSHFLFRFQTEMFYLTMLSIATIIQVGGTWVWVLNIDRISRNIDKGKLTDWKKSSHRCHSVHQKSHAQLPGNELRSPKWQTGYHILLHADKSKGSCPGGN